MSLALNLPIRGKPPTAPGSHDLPANQIQPPIQRIPVEMMQLIVKTLSIEDIFNLSLSSRHLQGSINDDSFCRAVLDDKAPYASETLEARKANSGFARAFRRLVKRRAAVSQTCPYIVDIVAVAKSWIYQDGVLCYTVEDGLNQWLRILNLHGSADKELVVDIHALVDEAIPDSESGIAEDPKVVHHAAGITSCLVTLRKSSSQLEHWLLVLKAAEGILFEPFRLESDRKLFVRNNADFLYFGTHSATSTGNTRRWALWGFSIKNNTRSPKRIVLLDLKGHEVGSNVCFEIIDNHFYAVSSKAPSRTRNKLHELYYTCFRFRVEDLEAPKVQNMGWRRCWRKSPSEGHDDERWGTLKLERNEASGKLHIVEGRKAAQAEVSGPHRAYYITEVVFPEENSYDELGIEEAHNASDGTDSSDYDDDLSDNDVVLPNETRYPRRRGFSYPRHHSLHEVHYLDDPPEERHRPFWELPLRDYHISSNTFLDLINANNSGALVYPRIFLRAGSRKLKPFPTSKDTSSAFTGWLDLREKIAQPYSPTHVSTRPLPSHADSLLHALYDRLDAASGFRYDGRMTAVGDERSIVYSRNNSCDRPEPLVYISFDPAAKPAGMHHSGIVSSERAREPLPRLSGAITQEKGKGKSSDGPSLGAPKATWMSEKKAQYLELLGHHSLDEARYSNSNDGS